MKGGQLDQNLQVPLQWSWEEMLALLNPASPGQRSSQLRLCYEQMARP